MAQLNHSRSKKISELKAQTTLSNQEHAWIATAQYDSRVNTYTNIALNVQAITSYSAEVAFAYSLNNLSYALQYVNNKTDYSIAYNFAYTTNVYHDVLRKISALSTASDEQFDAINDLSKIKQEWTSFSNLKNGATFEEIGNYINNDTVASKLVSYTFAYTMNVFDWQQVNGQQSWKNVIVDSTE